MLLWEVDGRLNSLEELRRQWPDERELAAVLRRTKVVVRRADGSAGGRVQTPAYAQAMKEARRIVEQRQYDAMVSGLPAKITPLGDTAGRGSGGGGADDQQDVLLWKETHRLITVVLNVLLSGVAVFVAVMYYADSMAPLRTADAGIKVLVALFAAMGVVAAEVFLIYRATLPTPPRIAALDHHDHHATITTTTDEKLKEE